MVLLQYYLVFTIGLVQCCTLRTRHSATAEKQCVSCTCLPIGWLTDRANGAMQRTLQNRRGCTISDIQNALIQEVLAAILNKKLSYRRETARQLRIHAQLTRCFSAVAV